jgi:hypothetical protein
MLEARRINAAIAVALLTVVALVAFGCGDSGPASTVEGFIETLKGKDCEKAVNFIDLEGVGASGKEVVKNCKETIDESEIVSYKVLDEKIDGDKAEVKVETVTKSNDGKDTSTFTINVVNKNGEWKISL